MKIRYQNQDRCLQSLRIIHRISGRKGRALSKSKEYWFTRKCPTLFYKMFIANLTNLATLALPQIDPFKGSTGLSGKMLKEKLSKENQRKDSEHYHILSILGFRSSFSLGYQFQYPQDGFQPHELHGKIHHLVAYCDCKLKVDERN